MRNPVDSRGYHVQIQPVPAQDAAVQPRRLAWDIWLVRVLLLISATWLLVGGRRDVALGCVVALAAACAPMLAVRTVGMPAPRGLERIWVFGLGVLGVSVALGLFDRIWQWGKLVHGVEGICITAMAALLLLGYRQRAQPGLPIYVAGIATLCIGITFGALWEFTEYVLDWLRYSDLQKSNADSMTDMLWNDLAAAATTVLVFHLYLTALSRQRQGRLGRFADALFTPLGDFLERHGKLAALLTLLGIVAYVTALWFAGRPVPGLPTD
jgi:hypothetical protein